MMRAPVWLLSALCYLLELYNQVEDLLFHATTSTPFLCVSLLSLSPNNNSVSHEALQPHPPTSLHHHHHPLPQKSGACICSQASGKSSCGHRPLHENYSVGVCQHKRLYRQRYSFTVLHPHWSTALLFIPPCDCMHFPHIQLHLSIVILIQVGRRTL